MAGKSASTSTTLGGFYDLAILSLGNLLYLLRPQTVFVLPAGILRRRSTNTLALSLWSLDGSGAKLADLQLIRDGVFSTSLQFQDYVTPDYVEQRTLRPAPTNIPPM